MSKINKQKAKKYYSGEIGNLFGIKFLPYYMQGWSKEKIELYLEILDRLPKKLAARLEEDLNSKVLVKTFEPRRGFTALWRRFIPVNKTIIFGDNAYGVTHKGGEVK